MIENSNNSFTIDHRFNRICICRDDQNYDCSRDELQPAYPGQKYVLKLTVIGFSTPVSIVIDDSPLTACKSQVDAKKITVPPNVCTSIDYIIQFKSRQSCELYIKGRAFTPLPSTDLFVYQNHIRVFHVPMILCPVRFTINALIGICECDPLLFKNMLIACDIDDHTISQPANTWIAATTTNGSHKYYISQDCPFDYCLSHPLKFNLLYPDSQCQMNRAGVMCGQCKNGYRAVFGSSQCRHCSSIYLLTLIPILTAGVVLVLFLFILNLTVPDGDVNAIFFYVNIIGI